MGSHVTIAKIHDIQDQWLEEIADIEAKLKRAIGTKELTQSQKSTATINWLRFKIGLPAIPQTFSNTRSRASKS